MMPYRWHIVSGYNDSDTRQLITNTNTSAKANANTKANTNSNAKQIVFGRVWGEANLKCAKRSKVHSSWRQAHMLTSRAGEAASWLKHTHTHTHIHGDAHVT